MPEGQDARGDLYGRLTRGAPLAVLVAAALYLAYRLLPVVQLVAVAMLLALVLRTAVRGLRGLGFGRRISVLVVVAALVGFGAFVGLFIVPRVMREIQLLYAQFPRYVSSLERLSQNVGVVPDLSRLTDRLTDLFYQTVGSLPSIVTSAAALAGALAVVVFLALYMSISPDPLLSGVLRLVPSGRREEARGLLRDVEIELRGWIAGVAVISLFVGVSSGLGLWLIGIPLPITFGLIAGLLNVVPYLGSTVGALLPMLVALTTDRPLLNALLVAVLFVVLNQLEGYLLQPLVMGRQVKLHPAMIIISFLVMGTLMGTVGALLAVPAAVVFSTLVDNLLAEDTPAKKEDEP